MSLKEELDTNFEDIKSEAKSFINTNIDYYHLWAFKVTTKASGLVLKIFVLSLLMLLALLFLSFAAAYALGAVLNNITYGFLAVGGIYVLLSFIIAYFRKQILDPLVIKKFSDIFFN